MSFPSIPLIVSLLELPNSSSISLVPDKLRPEGLISTSSSLNLRISIFKRVSVPSFSMEEFVISSPSNSETARSSTLLSTTL